MQSTLNKLLKVGKPIVIPAPPSFSGIESDAHTWSVAMTAKYMNEVLELPQYANQIKQSELNGLSFIGIDEEHLTPIKSEHSLHTLKMVTHAQLLREKVFEKAAIQRPKSIEDWNTVHVAAWLSYKQGCAEVGMNALRARVDGRSLMDMNDDQLRKLTGNSKQGDRAFTAIKDLVVNNVPNPKLPVDSEGEEPTSKRVKKSSKAKTAMQSRREAERAAEDTVNEPDPPPYHSNSSSTVPPPPLSRSASKSGLPVISETDDEKEDQLGAPDADESHQLGESKAQQLTRKKKKGKKAKNSSAEFEDKDGELEAIARAQSAKSDAALVALDSSFKSHLPAPPAQATDIVPLQDAYSNGEERKKFLRKISSLRQTVEEHTVSMNNLHAYASKLKRENDFFQQEQKALFLQNSTSSSVIRNLVMDRDAAVQELEKVVGMYESQARYEQDLLTRDIHSLVRSREQLAHENNSIELNNALSRVAVHKSTDQPAKSGEYTQPIRSQEAHKTPLTTPMGDSDSDLDEDDTDRRKSKTKSGLRQAGTGPSTVNISNIPSSPTTKSPLKFATESFSHRGMDGDNQQSLNRTAPAIVLTTPGKSSSVESVASSTVEGVHRSGDLGGQEEERLLKEVSLLAMVESTAQTEKDTWTALLKTYSYPRISSLNKVEDTRTLLTKISILWTRLGLRMLHDAHSNDNNVSKGVRKALRGLEKCARRSLCRGKIHSSEANVAASKGSSGLIPQLPTSTDKLSGSGSRGLSKTTKPSDSASSGDDCRCCCYAACNEYCVAVGVVFGMALGQRVLNRYPSSEEKTNLLYLLSKMNHGELPMTELSRDNLRDFIDSNIGINLKWDRFDSICQRIDVEKKGFVSTASVLGAFQQLTPLCAKLPSVNQALFVNLFALSAAVDAFAEKKLEFSEAFLSVVQGGAALTPSFSKLMFKERAALLVQQYGVAAVNALPAVEDVKVLEEQLFVSDLLTELSRPLAERLHATNHIDWRAVNNTKKQRVLEEHPLSVRNNSTYRSPVDHFSTHHTEVCAAASKNLQIYDGAEKDLLNSVATLFVTLLSFRRACLRHMLSVVGETDKKNASYKTLHSSVGTAIASDAVDSAADVNRAAIARTLLDKQSIKQCIVKVEQSIVTLLGNDKMQASTLLQNSNTITIAQQESLLCELLGIPVPCHCTATHCNQHSASTAGGLVLSQCLVEAALWRTAQFHETESALLSEEKVVVEKPLADSQTLRDIQRELHDTLWSEPGDEAAVGSSGKKNKIFKLKGLTRSVGGNSSDIYNHSNTLSSALELVDEEAIQVIEEVNGLMHRQRVEQTSRFLELLNAKAARKKKIIHSLMSLWKSTKVAVTHRNTVNSFAASTETKEQLRRYAMPVEDILSQTRQVQKALIDDMQKPASVKTAQLMERIALLRRGVQTGSILDEDDELGTALREIAALEDRLLQANGDAMKLAVKILNSLEQKS